MAEHPTRNRPECEASWAQAPERLVGTVVACPEYYCGKADVAVTWDAFGVPVYEPHIAAVKNGKPARRVGPLGYRDEAGQWQVADREDAA